MYETYKECLEAIRNKAVLHFVPEEFRTAELCLEAVKHSEWNLQYVPKELKTLELCSLAFERNVRVITCFPEELITSELCLKVVKREGKALSCIPREFVTPELCTTAVEGNSEALCYVPEEYKTPELCLYASRQWNDLMKGPLILSWTPKEFFDKDLHILTEEGLRKKYSTEELLTSSNAYLRKLGASNEI